MSASSPTLPSRWFRVLLLANCVCAWGITAYFASHVSEEATVLGRWSESYAMLLGVLCTVAFLTTLIHAPPFYARIWCARARVLAIGIGCALALAGCEILVRVLDPLGISYYAAAQAYHMDKVADDDLVFRHRPNHRAEYGGVAYAFNEIGLRDRPLRDKVSSELRVLVLGDSVTLASGVPVEDGFVQRLESLLSERLERPVRTINAGVGGYNTTQELAFLRRHGDELEPDMILLLYVYNDVEINEGPFDSNRRFRLTAKSPPQVAKTLLHRSWLFRLYAHTRVVEASAARGMAMRGSVGWHASMRDLGAISDWAAQRRIPFFLAYYGAVHDPSLDAELWSELGSFAHERALPLVNAMTWFDDRDLATLTNSAIDSHPNSAGHALLAEGFADFLGS